MRVVRVCAMDVLYSERGRERSCTMCTHIHDMYQERTMHTFMVMYRVCIKKLINILHNKL